MPVSVVSHRSMVFPPVVVAVAVAVVVDLVKLQLLCSVVTIAESVFSSSLLLSNVQFKSTLYSLAMVGS